MIFLNSIQRDGFRNTNLVYSQKKRTLIRHKSRAHPKVPHSILEIRDRFLDRAVMEKYGYNLENDGLFYIGTIIEKDFAFTVFASKYIIEFIQKNIQPIQRRYLMDGTFDSLPGDFYQLLIITVEYQNDVSNSSPSV